VDPDSTDDLTVKVAGSDSTLVTAIHTIWQGSKGSTHRQFGFCFEASLHEARTTRRSMMTYTVGIEWCVSRWRLLTKQVALQGTQAILACEHCCAAAVQQYMISALLQMYARIVLSHLAGVWPSRPVSILQALQPILA
jgi:hypothetical protein